MTKQATKKRSASKKTRASSLKKNTTPVAQHSHIDVMLGTLIFAMFIGIGFWVDSLATKTYSLNAIIGSTSRSAKITVAATSTYGYNATSTFGGYGYQSTSTAGYGYSGSNTPPPTPPPAPSSTGTTYGYNATSTFGGYGYQSTSTAGYGYSGSNTPPPVAAALYVIDLRPTHTVVNHGQRTRVYGILRGADGRRLSNMPLTWTAHGGDVISQGSRGSYQYVDIKSDYFENSGSLKVTASYFGTQETVSIKIRQPNPRPTPRLRVPR